MLSVNRLGAFEVEKVHHINVVDTSFVPRTWCLEILGDAVLLEFVDMKMRDIKMKMSHNDNKVWI